MSKKPLCVAILWHMHQPDYGNNQTGETYLPWTRFHAVKDYYDMGSLVAEIPGLRLTINVVPSLMDQLHAYAGGTARETYAGLTLRNAAHLDVREKAFLLRNFFQLPWTQMVLPFPRFKELLERRGTPDARGEYSAGLKRYTVRDYRDLQVWFNLAWCGLELRRKPEIEELIKKGSDFTEQDKSRLLEIQRQFIKEILPLYGRLAREHGIELSVSPYYHPIIPLLCDNRSAREALPDIALPSNPFRFAGDAREQIIRARRRYIDEFGRAPAGMWPSEGSISDATADLAREADFRWLASDDAVLFNSLAKAKRVGNHLTVEQKFSAYRWGDGVQGPCFFFRDHGLSDLIGFTYSRWMPEDASANFLHRLHGIHDCLPDNGRHYVVPIILDGENAWEHYPENGVTFLRALYRSLVEDPSIRTVTLSEFLDLEPCREPLASITAGSWIYGNLATWIGHPEKNRAWELLTAARHFLAARQRSSGKHPKLEEAYQEMLIGEGSDWFWWFGDDHQSHNAAEFDSLFRSHVKNIYLLLGEAYPTELDVPIKRAGSLAHYRNPKQTISPRLDGRVTDYFEWLPAGFVLCSGGAGSMHRTENFLDKIYFGYDTRDFYLRVDLARDLSKALIPGASLEIRFVEPRKCRLRLGRAENSDWECRWIGPGAPSAAPKWGAEKILEIGIPLEALDILEPTKVRFSLVITEKDREVERFPANDLLEVPVDPWGLDHQEWIV